MVYDRAGAAKRIRQRRKELGMTSAEVAGKIGRAVHYYGDIERGTCGMSIETLLDLSHYLDLSVDYILFGQAGLSAHGFDDTRKAGTQILKHEKTAGKSEKMEITLSESPNAMQSRPLLRFLRGRLD